MDCVKRYISHSEYKNVLLVNKDWNSIFSDTGAAQLVSCLRKGGWLDTETVMYLRYINVFEALHILVESLEYGWYKRPLVMYRKPMTGITSFRIRKNHRLNFIDLMGV
jgi:hypothetical protein